MSGPGTGAAGAIYESPEREILEFLRGEDMIAHQRGNPNHILTETYLAARIAYIVRAVAPAGAPEPSEAAIDAAWNAGLELRTRRTEYAAAMTREELTGLLRAAYAMDFGAAAPRDAPREPSEAATLAAMRECFLRIEHYAKWGRNLPDSKQNFPEWSVILVYRGAASPAAAPPQEER